MRSTLLALSLTLASTLFFACAAPTDAEDDNVSSEDALKCAPQSGLRDSAFRDFTRPTSRQPATQVCGTETSFYPGARYLTLVTPAGFLGRVYIKVRQQTTAGTSTLVLETAPGQRFHTFLLGDRVLSTVEGWAIERPAGVYVAQQDNPSKGTAIALELKYFTR